MSKPTLEKRIRGIAGDLDTLADNADYGGVFADDIIEVANPDTLREIADEVKTMEAALRPVVEALGNHYCGNCGNVDIDESCQPYSEVTDPDFETCADCRRNYDAYRAGYDALHQEDTNV